MSGFSIIIPTLNEVGNISVLLQRISAVVELHSMAAEVIFVDDGSTDGTREAVQNEAKNAEQNPVRVYENCVDESVSGSCTVRLLCRDGQRGLAGAVVAGARAARYDHLLVMDGDLSHPPELIPELITPLLEGRREMMLASRYVEGGATPDWPWIRRAGSQLASVPARLLTHVTDPLSGYFAVTRQRLLAADSSPAGFKIALELLAHTPDPPAAGEVPVVFVDRCKGKSKMGPAVCLQYLGQLARLAWGRLDDEFCMALPLLVVVGVLCGVLDATLFGSLHSSFGWSVGTSHMISQLVAFQLCYPFSRLLPWRRAEPWSPERPGAKEGARQLPGYPLLADYGRFLFVILLGLFLRGGVLAFPLFSTQSAFPAQVLIVFAGSLVSWMGGILVLYFQVLHLRTLNWSRFGTFVLCYTVLLRVLYAGNIELIQEEAYYWNYAHHLATGYLDHPPVIALLIRLGTDLFGDNEFGVRFAALLCWGVSSFFIYRTTAIIFNRAAAFRALVLAAALPLCFGVGLLSTPDAPLVACWAGVVYYLYRCLVRGEMQCWYGLGFWLGLGMASKYTIVLLGPATLCYMLLRPGTLRQLLRLQPYAALLLALLIFSPVIWWNYQHEWASFLFQSKDRINGSSTFSTHLLVLSCVLLLSPVGFISAVRSLAGRCLRVPMAAANAVGSGPARLSCPDWKEVRLFYLLMVVVPLAVFVLFSLTREVKLNWTGPLWLAIIPVIAWRMGPAGSLVATSATGSASTAASAAFGGWREPSRVWPVNLAALMLIYGFALHYCAFGLPETSFVKSVFLYGWDDLAAQVEGLVDVQHSVQGEHSAPPLVVGMDSYRAASGLSFYLNKYESGVENMPRHEGLTTGRHLFGLESLMYSYWLRPEQAGHRDLLVVAEKEWQLDPRLFAGYCGRVGDLGELDFHKRGKEAGHLYYRLLSAYSPLADSAESADTDAGDTGAGGSGVAPQSSRNGAEVGTCEDRNTGDFFGDPVVVCQRSAGAPAVFPN